MFAYQQYVNSFATYSYVFMLLFLDKMMRDMLKISYMAAMGEGLDKYRDKKNGGYSHILRSRIVSLLISNKKLMMYKVIQCYFICISFISFLG